MSEARSDDAPGPETITVTREGDWYVARDEESGVASQGRSKATALANLAEALGLHAEDTADADAETPDAPWF
jgi:predicted RNase H-like HicB family nuclease